MVYNQEQFNSSYIGRLEGKYKSDLFLDYVYYFYGI